MDGPVQLVVITESLRIFVLPAMHFLSSLATSCTLTHGMVLRVPSRMHIRTYYAGPQPDPHSRAAIYNDINKPHHLALSCLSQQTTPLQDYIKLNYINRVLDYNTDYNTITTL